MTPAASFKPLAALSVALAAAAQPPPSSTPPAAVSAPVHPCAEVFAKAHDELIGAGFRPSTNMDEFFRVDVDGLRIELMVYTVYSPDGDGFRQYRAEVAPFRGRRAAWHLSVVRMWDEFHEEHLPERTWIRATGRWRATIFVRADEDNESERSDRKQFEAITRPALDRCLKIVGAG